MGFFTFLGAMGKEKVKDAQSGIMKTIVSLDPEGASKADIELMIKELDKITIETGKAKAEYEREKAEADAAIATYNKHMAAAEMLAKQLDEAKANGNEDKAAELDLSLSGLVGALEQLEPEVAREKREAEEAKAYYDDLLDIAKATAEKLKNARAALDKAKKDMQRAELEQSREESKAAKAEQLAGLRKSATGVSTAVEAMQAKAAEAGERTEALRLKTSLINPDKPVDKNVQAALSAVSGEATSTGSVSDRLAALKNRG